MKKLLFTLLMGLFLSPVQMFAEYYEYDEMMPLPKPPVKSPDLNAVAFNLDYYTGALSITPNYNVTGLNITLERNGVTYINDTVSLTAGQSYTDSLAGYDAGVYILTLSTSDGVIDQYAITVVAD